MESSVAAPRPSQSEEGRIIAELRAIADDPARSKEDRKKAERAYRQLTYTIRTAASAQSGANKPTALRRH